MTSGGTDSADGGIDSSETARLSGNRSSRSHWRTHPGAARASPTGCQAGGAGCGRSAGARHRVIVSGHRSCERRDVIQVRGIPETPGTISRASAASGSAADSCRVRVSTAFLDSRERWWSDCPASGPSRSVRRREFQVLRRPPLPSSAPTSIVPVAEPQFEIGFHRASARYQGSNCPPRLRRPTSSSPIRSPRHWRRTTSSSPAGTGRSTSHPSRTSTKRSIDCFSSRWLPPGIVAFSRLVDGCGIRWRLPAIPLKLALPRLRLTMVESKARKSAFLREAVRHLGLENATVETARYEELLAGQTSTRPATSFPFAPCALRPGCCFPSRRFLRPAAP